MAAFLEAFEEVAASLDSPEVLLQVWTRLDLESRYECGQVSTLAVTTSVDDSSQPGFTKLLFTQ